VDAGARGASLYGDGADKNQKVGQPPSVGEVPPLQNDLKRFRFHNHYVDGAEVSAEESAVLPPPLFPQCCFSLQSKSQAVS